MKRRQVAVTVALAVCAVSLVAVPVVGHGVAPDAQVDNASSANATNGSFGQQVASFMQASAADADASVERGMWQASVNQTLNESGDPGPKVTGRVGALERRLQRLQNRTEQLEANRENLPEVAYTARASALRAQMANLREDVNATERTAMRVGVNASSLGRLRAAAGNATGPDVAATARMITDAPRGPPADVPGGGPPDDRGPGGPDRANRTTGGDTGNGDLPGRDSGQSADGPGNATTGPGPADSGPGESETDDRTNATSGGDARSGDRGPGESGTDDRTNATSGGDARSGDREGGSDSSGGPAAPDESA